MKEKWKFTPITIKTDDAPPIRMICYHKDFERLYDSIIKLVDKNFPDNEKTPFTVLEIARLFNVSGE